MSRTRDDDACPGALQLHQAADGSLARIRLPGGMIGPAALAALAELAAERGAGTLELTARGNVQIRGIEDGPAGAAEVAAAVCDAGLLPSPEHERVRNIVASPLSGRSGGLFDIRPWVIRLDDAIRADPELPGLPGRFWFSIDDGTGDVGGLGADVGLHVTSSDGHTALTISGRDTGIRLDPVDWVAALITVARRFVRTRGIAWRIAELADPRELLTGFTRSAPAGRRFPAGRPPIGWITQRDGLVALGAAVPLGVLSARQAHVLAALDAPTVFTAWRSLVVCDLTEPAADAAIRVLAPMGLVFDDTSPWLSISACVGSPGCARSRADVRAAAAAAALGDGSRGHYVGCERACGSPSSGTVLLATGDGFEPMQRRT